MLSLEDIDVFEYTIFPEKKSQEKEPSEDLLSKLTLGSLKTKTFTRLDILISKLGEMIQQIEFRREPFETIEVYNNRIELTIQKPGLDGVFFSSDEEMVSKARKLFTSDNLASLSQDFNFIIGVWLGLMHTDRLKSRIRINLSKKIDSINLNSIYRGEYRDKLLKVIINPRLTGLQLDYEETLLGAKTLTKCLFYHSDGKLMVRSQSDLEGMVSINLSEIIKNRLEKINDLMKYSFSE